MKKHYLKTANKKVMGAVLLAATMMVGLAACGGDNASAENTQESSVIESTIESTEESTEESSEEMVSEESEEDSSVEASGEENSETAEEDAQTRTYVYDVDGVETEYTETLFESADGFRIWYPADLLEVAEILGHEGFVQAEVPEGTGVSFMMVPGEASLDMDVMLKEATSNFNDGTYETVNVGETVELESESGMTIKYMDVIHDDTADRFYAISDGVTAMLVTVTASAEELEEMGMYLDRMAQTVEFQTMDTEVKVEE